MYVTLILSSATHAPGRDLISTNELKITSKNFIKNDTGTED